MATVADVRREPAHPISFDLLAWLSTTDHKAIGVLYLTASGLFFLLAGLMAEVMRLELAQPGMQVVDASTYNQLFTMHGTIMLLLFATPTAIGFANYFIPLQIGAADMAFPRLNALTFWMFLFGAIVTLLGFGTAGGAAATGWTAYAPLSENPYAPGPGFDLWIAGLLLTGVSTVLGSVNLITTIYGRRAPGMRMFRMPVFTWNILVTAVMILFAFPPLTAAFAMLFIDRHFSGGIFDPARGGDPVLYQHLFWFFGHPEVYIIALPFFGIVSEVFPVFSRKPLFGYRFVILATIAIAGLSMTVWAHHMFTTGFINLPFFSIMSLLIAVPTGIKIFNWTATMWGGHIRLSSALLFSIGLIYIFVVGGVTGVMLASPPLDFDFQDTYFVVAHMHNVMIGATVFGAFAGIYFWFPKMSGRFLDERLGRIHWAAWMVGFTLTFIPQYQLGVDGMPRRVADYAASTGWGSLNALSSVGAAILGLGTIPFFVAIVLALRKPETAGPDPWEGNSLEWATSSPPPDHNFVSLPPITSERPVFDERMRRQGIDPRTLRVSTGPGSHALQADTDDRDRTDHEEGG
ncbi:MAG TPA: cytochrome c oxidase subunit I [Candidatus Limnocylindrales bacterium]|nr:cytochrome c oxidase subunit I [Candidatus Limnocylindrales bacterium]